jgi:hypothetical protein
MLDLTTSFDANGWKFSPGPPHQTEPVETINCVEAVELPIEDVARALLTFPGIERASEREARLTGDSDGSPLRLTVTEWFAGVWGGISLEGTCSLGLLLALWAHLLANHPGIWLFYTADEPDLLHTPKSFLEWGHRFYAERVAEGNSAPPPQPDRRRY